MKTHLLVPVALLFLMASGCAKPSSERGHKRILVLGDSLTEGYGLESAKVFPAQLEKLIKEKGFPDVAVTADGISGATSATGLPRLQARMDAGEKVDLLILELGANDGLQGMDLEALRRNLSACMDLVKSKGGRTLLAGMRVPPLNGLGYMKDFRELFPDLAKEKGVLLIPFLLEDVAGQPRLNLDGVHPNEAGQRIVAQNVFKILEPFL